MGDWVKAFAPCIECGEPTQHRRTRSRAPLCPECALVRFERSVREQAEAARKRREREHRYAVRQARRAAGP